MTREEHFTANKNKNTKSVLEKSRIFAGVAEAITPLINIGKIIEYNNGDILITQEERDKDVYIVLEGMFDILINGKSVSTKGPAEILGEMSVVDPAAKRSATVRALEDSVIIHFSEVDFCNVADKYPWVWRNIAAEIASRLRERDTKLQN